MAWLAALPLIAVLSLPLPARSQTAPAPTEIRHRVSDSLTLVADVHRGRAGPAGATILLFHQGGGSARGEYRTITPRLLRDGYNIIAADVRGGGDRFGSPSRAAPTDSSFSYCVAAAEVDAAITLARMQGFSGPLVLWGSSYTAALVLQVAARRSADVRAVLAFSPASGEPMRGCEPAPYVGRLRRAGVPVMVLRPRVELADSQRLAALEAMRRDGATVTIAERGVHGSSMLDEERTKASTDGEWSAVRAFLRSALQPRTPRVRYLANEGVLLEGSGGRVLIDALFGDGLPEYSTVPLASRDSLERAVGPYGGPAVVLFTHAHRDHFDSAAVERYRRSNPAAVVIGPPVQGAAAAQPADLGWVRVRPLAIPHGPTRRPVGHAAWLVTLDGTTALHLGDTQSDPATWRAAGVPPAGVDLALVPYWYALEEGRLEAAMAVLKARRVVLFHTSLDAADRGWTETSRRLRERFAQVRTPVMPGESVD